MALKLKSIAADLQKENEGDWVDVAEWPGVRFKVRSINSRDYQNAREERIRKLGKALGRAPYSSEIEPHIGRLAATFLLLGWEGIADDDEQPIEYSQAKAIELMSDPEMREMATQVVLAASRIGDRDAEFTKVTVKN